MAIKSIYVFEVIFLPDLDWCSRHERYRNPRGSTMDAVKARMPPDLLLDGQYTSMKVQPGHVIALPNKQPKQLLMTDFFKVIKKTKSEPVGWRRGSVRGREARERDPR